MKKTEGCSLRTGELQNSHHTSPELGTSVRVIQCPTNIRVQQSEGDTSAAYGHAGGGGGGRGRGQSLLQFKPGLHMSEGCDSFRQRWK